MKAYTDLNQSKKLAEILPLESADMFYTTNSDWEGKIIGLLDVPLYMGSDSFVDTEMGEIYAWSLAALLDVIPEGVLESYYVPNIQKEDGRYTIAYGDEELLCTADNPVDACVEMIIKLHEQKIL